MNVFVYGDLHGHAQQLKAECDAAGVTIDDLVVLLGDVCVNYFLNNRDRVGKQILSGMKPTFLCIHGNHEARPGTLPQYREMRWNGGVVYVEDEFPTILFAEDGEVYELNGMKVIAIGGAYSVDKDCRLARGWRWFPDEQPSEETKRYVEEQVRKNPNIDVILSHTCPAKYTPIECFLPGVDQSKADCSTEQWLDKLEEKIEYKAWYCGHWHIDKDIDRLHFRYQRLTKIE